MSRDPSFFGVLGGPFLAEHPKMDVLSASEGILPAWTEPEPIGVPRGSKRAFDLEFGVSRRAFGDPKRAFGSRVRTLDKGRPLIEESPRVLPEPTRMISVCGCGDPMREIVGDAANMSLFMVFRESVVAAERGERGEGVNIMVLVQRGERGPGRAGIVI